MGAVARTGVKAVGKPKTKAKLRYLKAKKHRRKIRKASGPKPFGQGKKKKLVDESHTEEPHEEPKAATHAAVEEDAYETTEESDSSSKSEEDETSTEDPPLLVTADSLQPLCDDDNDDVAQKDAAPSNDTSSPKYLYRFPRPQKTGEAHAQQLATQGIPDALARPVDVIATQTESLMVPDGLGSSLSPTVRQQLHKLGITEWFAVQASVVPWLLSDCKQSSLYLPYTPPRDLCVSAPTGSGKTLAYTVPIVELLQTRTVTQLRALILVPTRDLAVQVRDMFEAVGKRSGLTIAMITGNHSFRHEQAQLVRMDGPYTRSMTDVLIATPGRLVDHLQGTPGFTLEHLRFLVIDEADRLLGQSFQQWVSTLLDALESPRSIWMPLAPQTHYQQSESWTHDDMDIPQHSAQKLLFSATLTRDPEKMTALRLRDPHYIRVRDTEGQENDGEHERFALPSTLSQHVIITPSSDKVLHLLRLLHSERDPVRQALCFTKSVEAANRLERLLHFFEEAWSQQQQVPALHVQFYSSDLSTGDRMAMLRKFQRGEIDLLVCSDLIARGIDLPEVRHVIMYDVPIDMAKYVHRVGRTARAGRAGDAWSLVEEQEVFHFKRMLSEAGQWERVQSEKGKTAKLEPYMPPYKEALARLAQVYSQQR
ncbi:RNA helicase [Malassezia nana]|uniref:ATP-dependent RNA helicase n=1 Tax=Malassezia nana TaxID=180528 RepID=A0AAF0J3Q4_9BASI|nr:RNA helicase [Malassezia nana]